MCAHAVGLDLSLPLERLSPTTGTTTIQTDPHPDDNWSYVNIDVQPFVILDVDGA